MSFTVVKLAELIKQDRIVLGELLWQGSYGFCIANGECNRNSQEKCDVLLLQQGSSKKTFSASLLVPLDGLLSSDIVDDSILPQKARGEIKFMIDELHAGLRHSL
jgi:hypothetical protein